MGLLVVHVGEGLAEKVVGPRVHDSKHGYSNAEQGFYCTIRTWRGEATVLQTAQALRDMAGEPQAGSSVPARGCFSIQ